MKTQQRRRRWQSLVPALALGTALAGLSGCVGRIERTQDGPPVPAYVGPAQMTPGNQTYVARWIPPGSIRVDGRADEPAWAQAVVEKRFVFPWKGVAAPETEFRALWDNEHLYFAFRVQDVDVVVVDNWRDERDAVFEDRVEIYFSRDDALREYFCAEIDPHGRVFDYRARFYRRFEPEWTFTGLEAKGNRRHDGYEVEGRIPLRALAALGFPTARPGVKIRLGLYRAEFSHDRSGRAAALSARHTLGRQPPGPPPVEEWISWVNPKTAEPDFHVPSSLGWLEFVK